MPNAYELMSNAELDAAIVALEDETERLRALDLKLDMVLSAVVTPDASPVTMVLMFAALIALYEIALAVARYAIIARDGKAALKWSREDYEEHGTCRGDRPTYHRVAVPGGSLSGDCP